MQGKTDEARADLARLAIIRKQREEAAKKRAEQAGKGSRWKIEFFKGMALVTLGVITFIQRVGIKYM